MPGVAEAWEAAVEVTAAAYRVDPAILRAASRGRGPRPPKEAWAAKKMVVFVVVAVAGVDYASLGRAIGLHRDTVASHCAAIRAECDDDNFEIFVQGLVIQATYRAQLAAKVLSLRTEHRRAADLGVRARVRNLEAAIERLSSDTAIHPTTRQDHENVIELSQKKVSA